MGTIKIYRREGEKGRRRWGGGGGRGGGGEGENSLAEEQKAGLMITWDLENVNEEGRGFISLLVQSPFLP